MTAEEVPHPGDASEALADGACRESQEAAVTPLTYLGYEVLAPMVRASTLPLRLECLRYGADLVYGEEIVDRKIIGAMRLENPVFRTVDFVSPREKGVVFSTCAEERSRVIFQIGTADPVLAAEAAQVVCGDVRGVDVNMGCPKSFSVKGGMGAALLSKPEVASEILKTLRRTLPSSCSVTCKIRMLGTTAATRDFMQMCERSGAEEITVHLRTRDERPVEPAHWDEMVRLWDAVNVPVLANGDFFTRKQVDKFWDYCSSSSTATAGDANENAKARRGPAGIMIARGALWNPSIFCKNGREPPPLEEVVKRYVRAAVCANCTFQNTKWVLAQMLAGGTGAPAPIEFLGRPTKAFNQDMSRCKSMAAICTMLGDPLDATAYPAQAHTTTYYYSMFASGQLKVADGDGAAGGAAEGAPQEGAEGDSAADAEDGGPAQKRPRTAA